MKLRKFNFECIQSYALKILEIYTFCEAKLRWILEKTCEATVVPLPVLPIKHGFKVFCGYARGYGYGVLKIEQPISKLAALVAISVTTLF